jgi:hypothetical protein
VSSFRDVQVPPKFGQLPQQDLGPFIAEIETFTFRLAREVARNEDERIRSVLREAFEAGEAHMNAIRDLGLGYVTEPTPDFDEWLDNFITERLEASE